MSKLYLGYCQLNSIGSKYILINSIHNEWIFKCDNTRLYKIQLLKARLEINNTERYYEGKLKPPRHTIYAQNTHKYIENSIFLMSNPPQTNTFTFIQSLHKYLYIQQPDPKLGSKLPNPI